MKALLVFLISLNVFAANNKDFKSNKSWLIEVGKGNVKNHEIVHKFGQNPAVGTTLVPVTSAGLYQTPTTLQSLEIISDSANDTAAGTGARTVKIWGINNVNGSWTEDSETITLNGTTAVNLTKQWYRVYRMRVVTSGTYATGAAPTHTSTIALRHQGAGAVWGRIDNEAGFGLSTSEIGAFTIPKGKRASFIASSIHTDSTKLATIVIFSRENADTVTAPFSPMTTIRINRNVAGFLDINSRPGESWVEGPADIGIMTKLASGTGSVEVEFELVMVSY